MRPEAIAILLVVLVAAQPALGAGRDAAAPALAAPSRVVAHDLGASGTLLVWSPVADATSYVILRGPNASALRPVGESLLPQFLDAPEPSASGGVYGILARHTGQEETPVVLPPLSGSACVSMSSSLTVSVSLASCLQLSL